MGEASGSLNAPAAAHAQLEEVLHALRDHLGADLVGFYVHGSLALGCFNAARSDLDVIAVTARELDDDERFAITDLLLRVSARPYGIEAHVVTTDQLRPWRYPPPYDLHYSETHRERLAVDSDAVLARPQEGDADLALHYDVARQRAIALAGPPAAEVFPHVPRHELEDALRRDFEFCRGVRSALYGVLSPCRVWAALETGELHSKASGAEWALTELPPGLRPPVERALKSYRGNGEPIELDESDRAALLDHVARRLERRADPAA